MNLTARVRAVGAAAGAVTALMMSAAAAESQQGGTFRVGQPLGTTVNGAFQPMSSNVKVYGGVVSAESCSYDAGRGLIAVVNRGVAQNVAQNDGFISFLNHDGSVHTPIWIGITRTGLTLNQPLGSDIQNGRLYVADRDGGTSQSDPSVNVVRWFDLATGAPGGEIRIPESGGFNDIAVTADGTIYGTQTGSPMRVYRIRPDGTWDHFVDGAPLTGPNGIALDPEGNIVVVNVASPDVLTFSPAGQLIRTESAAQGGNDGIVIMPDGTKYVSSVQLGGVSRIRPGQPAELIATSIPSAASMCYDAGANQLVIPMNPNNSVAIVPLD
jgi:hypothetical protein